MGIDLYTGMQNFRWIYAIAMNGMKDFLMQKMVSLLLIKVLWKKTNYCVEYMLYNSVELFVVYVF
jgi:hypothetical protein